MAHGEKIFAAETMELRQTMSEDTATAIATDITDSDITLVIAVPDEKEKQDSTLVAPPNLPSQGTNVLCLAHTDPGALACHFIAEQLAKADSGPKKDPKLNYRVSYSLVRGGLSFAAVTATVMLDSHSSFWPAAVQGSLAGVWSAGMQYWNKEFLAWLASDGWLSLEPAQPGKGRPFLKKAVSSTVYAALLHSGLASTGLAKEWVSPKVIKKITKAVGLSIFTQTYWQTLNHRWTREAIARNPGREALYRKNSARGSLIQSLISVVNNALNISDSPAGILLTGAVGGSGFVTNQVDKRKPEALALVLPIRKKVPSQKPGCDGALEDLAN